VIARRFVPLSFLLLLSFTCVAQDQGAEETLSAIVTLEAKALPNARSAATLGHERRGAGALIRDGYVLTIGYLVIEAASVNVTGADGKTVPATVAGYDHASGFALLKLIAPFSGKPLALGEAAALTEQAPAIVATSPAREGVAMVRVASRRPFSGSWEYHLESAIFTYPPVLECYG
jgi:S1-C subfamily serine protease